LTALLAAGIGAGAWALVDHYTGTHGTTYVAPAGAPAIPAFDPAIVADYGAPDPWMLAVVTGGIAAYSVPVGAPSIAMFDPAIIAKYGPPDPWLYAVVTRYVPPAGAPAVPAFDPVVVAQYGPPDPWMFAATTGGFA
jgi:hypothetical protein